MARPIWKGYITFGLVSIPVILYSAEKKSDIQFNLVDERDQSRIHYLRVNENTGKEVPWENIVKGYEYSEGNMVLITQEELKKIAGENTKLINIESFVEKETLDPILFEKPYYLVPEKKDDKGYVILRETLIQTGKVGITKVIIHTRQYLAALMPYKTSLILNILRYPQEIRAIREFEFPSKNIKSYKINQKEIEIAEKLITLMTSKWAPNQYQDEFKLALEKWIEEKVSSKKPRTHMKKISIPKARVVNFVDLLKKSVKEQRRHH